MVYLGRLTAALITLLSVLVLAYTYDRLFGSPGSPD
jgi:hypothetical protein